MTLHVKIKFKLTCPRHRKYDPAKSGESGIKAGCEVCRGLFEFHLSAIQLDDRARKHQEEISDRMKRLSTILT